ncbi:MAG: hypothetical protein PHT76_06640 [Anaerostipes sp.]|nr:hypothetical protein [Anaerostipes sp.]
MECFKENIKKTKYFTQRKGNKINFKFIVSNTTNVKIGIMRSGGKKNYVNATTVTRGTISVPTDGKYCVFVENNSNKATNVNGNYTR